MKAVRGGSKCVCAFAGSAVFMFVCMKLQRLWLLWWEWSVCTLFLYCSSCMRVHEGIVRIYYRSKVWHRYKKKKILLCSKDALLWSNLTDIRTFNTHWNPVTSVSRVFFSRGDISFRNKWRGHLSLPPTSLSSRSLSSSLSLSESLWKDSTGFSLWLYSSANGKLPMAPQGSVEIQGDQ